MTNVITPILAVQNLTKHYANPRRWLETPRHTTALDNVCFHVNAAETLSIVGESGSGKTTIAKAVVRLIEPTSGSVMFDGEDLLALSSPKLRLRRRDLQIIFQDPYASLNPRLKVIDIVSEPLGNFALGLSKSDIRERAEALLIKVGLHSHIAGCHPHQLSGGQRQRVAIARALAPRPKLIVCDEAVSALDVSVQAQVINLLMDLQTEFGVAYLFIAHNLAVVRHISHRIAVMQRGRIVETNDCEVLFQAPVHPYTRALLAASIPLRRRSYKATPNCER